MKSKRLLLILTTALFSSLLTVSTSNFAADFTQSTPTEDFIDNKDGTVTHKKTGLIWQRCAVGQTWIEGDCDDVGSEISFYDAMAIISKMPEKSDWRLPRIDELLTIVEYNSSFPAINKTIFPFTPIGSFWTSSISTNNTETGWVVNFGDGANNLNELKKTNFIRLVRGENNLNRAKEYTPTVDFTDNKDGTVTHKKTGLTWQKCAIGQTWTETNCDGSANEMDYYDAIKQTSNLGGHNDWRLPRISELTSITEFKNSKPAINQVIFPNTKGYFWSISGSFFNPDSKDKDLVVLKNDSDNRRWAIDFNDGEMVKPAINDTEDRQAVRLVRGGKSLSLDATKDKKSNLEAIKETQDEKDRRSVENAAAFAFYELKKRSEQITKKHEVKAKNEQKTSKSADGITQEIVQRCKNSMGQHGAAMVKACVDQDLEALVILGTLVDSNPVIVNRCMNNMKQHGFAIIKACVDQDIAAEEALKRY